MNSQSDRERLHHPRERANILSIFTYCWTFPIFVKGFKRDLQDEDLFKTLKVHESATLGDKLENSWIQEEKLYKKPSLWRALGRVFGTELAMYGFVLVFIELVLKMSQPLALFQLMTFYTEDNSNIDKNEALLCAGIIIGSTFLYAIISHWYSLGLQHFGMKIRVACCSLIYRKTLQLNKTTIGKTTAGKLVNLLSNDVNRFDQAAVHVHSLWFVPIEIAIIVYALYRLLGFTSIIGVGFMLLFVPLQVYLGRKTASLRLKTAVETDRRVNLMNEIVNGVRVIKMYTWEKQFVNLVETARRLEINKICKNSYFKGIILSCNIFTTKFAIFLTILIHVLLGNQLTAKYAFVITSFYNILRQAMTRYFPQGIAQIGEASTSAARVQEFLLQNRKPNKSADKYYIKSNIISNGIPTEFCDSKDIKSCETRVEVVLKNVTARWSLKFSDITLNSISMNVKNGQLTAIIGPVGGGKTSLLNVILKELPIEKGLLNVSGKISYASQEPWLFAGTVRQNILFGETMNEERYNEVIRVCDLQLDFAILPRGDETLVGERGVTLSGGQRSRIGLARAIYRNADIYLLDDPLSAVDAHVGKSIFEECISKFLKGKCTILVTHQLQHLQNVDEIIVMENGRIVTRGSYRDLKQSQVEYVKRLHEENDGNTINRNEVGKKTVSLKSSIEKIERSETKEQTSQGSVSKDIYVAYFKAGGSLVLILLVFMLFIATQFCGSAADYFVAYWVNLEQIGIDDGLREESVYIYSGIITSLIFLTFVRSLSFFKFCMKASSRLHNDMFSNIVHSTLNFFNVNPSGRILNRFSKDMGSIDEQLPSILIDCIQIGLSLIGVIVVVNIVNKWMLVVTVIILAIFYLFRTIYLATSRSIKRLEGTTRSPVFAHVTASLHGLAIIRAFGAQGVLQKEFDDYQDVHSSAWYLFLACSRAFGFWLDMICTIYISVVTFSLLLIKNEYFGGNVGLAITQTLSLTGLFQWGMRQWSELENQMTSVERVVEYTNLQQECDENQKAPENWPETGKIEFKSVSLKYSPTNNVLHQLNFAIEPKEKIGIVGRTGAGKTSLINALFRLYPIEGTILVDNLDITQIHLQDLRSKISIIPQEPFLFSGTLQKNLDPFGEFSDLDLWKALEQVELKAAISTFPEGLDCKISEGGANFSVGQRQLLCLARAIIRKNKILILDEATANLDPQTDELIQKTIRRKFEDCTVLTIAHRLHTVMDSDKVLVVDDGNVAEFGHPHLLLENKGLFWSMVQQIGNGMAEHLKGVAEKNYKLKLEAEE